MKTYGGVDILSHIFFTSALAEGEWSASRPGHFIPVERALSTHWIRDWVELIARLDDVQKTKFVPYRDSNSDHSVVQPIPTTLSRLHLTYILDAS
jgi:hypothetical protein